MSDLTPRLGVSACLFRAGKVLLVERDRSPFAGRLSMPGGGVAFGERMEDAVRREVEEETGYRLPRFQFFALHEVIEAEVHAVIAVYRGAREIAVGQEPVAGDDARSCRFVEIGALAGMEADNLLTTGLAALVQSAHRAHLLGL